MSAELACDFFLRNDGDSHISNLHNRLGEAEKSHLKARSNGHSVLWTIIHLEGFDLARAKTESPTTTEFFDIAEIENPNSDQAKEFRKQLLAEVSVR